MNYSRIIRESCYYGQHNYICKLLDMRKMDPFFLICHGSNGLGMVFGLEDRLDGFGSGRQFQWAKFGSGRGFNGSDFDWVILKNHGRNFWLAHELVGP
jgi:hypothetical protein